MDAGRNNEPDYGEDNGCNDDINGGCQADSVQHGHYDAGGYCSGGSDKNYDQSMVLLNSQTGGRNKKQFMLWTRMQIDGVKIREAVMR